MISTQEQKTFLSFYINSHGNTPLHLASSSGHIEVVEFIVEKGCDVNVKNYDGNTPLHLATISQQLEVIKYLVDNGANAALKNNNNQLPLDLSRFNNNPPIVEYLSSMTNNQQKDANTTCGCRI